MSKKTSKEIICSFCVGGFTPDQIWWVKLKMHRDDPNCGSFYSTACCEKCKDSPKNSWMILGVSEEPKKKKERKTQK